MGGGCSWLRNCGAFLIRSALGWMGWTIMNAAIGDGCWGDENLFYSFLGWESNGVNHFAIASKLEEILGVQKCATLLVGLVHSL
ncbi:hypothetical protein BDZ89DRAFT_52014 [Hymenopellis radicata]|nr:hypothetical protein BDZ89DRAFT_52014 [Hymenopellis radicata]